MDILFGLYQLRRNLPPDARGLFEEYEMQMLNNLHRKRLFDNPEDIRLEQARLLTLLDQLALTYYDTCFSLLCDSNSSVSKLPGASITQAKEVAHTAGSEERVEDEIILYNLPQIKVKFFTRILPTNYCQLLDQDLFPFILISIDNTHEACTDVTIKIQVSIERYSDDAIKTLDIAANEKRSLSLRPVLPRAEIASLSEITLATLHIQINVGGVQREHTELVQLLACNTALLGVKTADGSIKELVDYLALWVTPHHQKIDEWLRKALHHHSQREFVGYQQTADGVRRQARAIFDLLYIDIGLSYTDSSISFGIQNEQVAQRVRFPADVLTMGAANCLEGALLFASFLEHISLDPLILILPFHAVVGWKIESGKEQYEFLDTTLIGKEDFTTAQRKGQSYFEDAQSSGLFEKILFDFTGYARLVDIQACRTRDIYP